MNELLDRNSFEDRSLERRRLVVIVTTVLVLSGLWHGLRGPLFRYCARASVGCHGRSNIVCAGLRDAGFSLRTGYEIRMHCLPRPGWVAWSSGRELRMLHGGLQRPTRFQTTIVDSDFRLLGIIPLGQFYGAGTRGIHEPPMDIDGDGRWEIRVGVTTENLVGIPYAEYLAVLRMGPSGNEVIWLGLIDYDAWAARKIWVEPKWMDTDGDGLHELAFIKIGPAPRLSSKGTPSESDIIAEFAMDRVGGILRTRSLPDGYGITPWNPPNDAPVLVGQTVKLEEVFVELLPPPSN